MLSRIADSMNPGNIDPVERVSILIASNPEQLAPTRRAALVERLLVARDKLIDLGAPARQLEIGLAPASRTEWTFDIRSGAGG